MTRIRCTLAILFSIALTAEASAQFFPPPIFGVPVVVQGGVQFKLGGQRLRINGFVPLGPATPAVLPVTPTPFGLVPVAPAFVPYGYGYGYPFVAPGFPFPGYGSISQRYTLQVITPAVIVQGRGAEAYDLSGIDLDVESPDKIWAPKQAVAKGGAPKKVEVAKAPPPPAEKKVEVAAAPAKPPPPPPPPKVEPVPEGQRLTDLGIAAFRKGEYGVAILRLRQSADANPPGPRAAFLQGQACIAVGKYREAAQLIQTGLQGQPTWPTSAFRPKVELYDNKDDVWKEHRTALETAQKLDPKNADYLFLLGYLSWFDGERDAARDYFQQARRLAAEPRWSDAFLKVAKND